MGHDNIQANHYQQKYFTLLRQSKPGKWLRTLWQLLSQFKPEPANPKILMFGNSLVRMGNWRKLLGRKDLVNRGIGGDSLPGMYQRLQSLRNIPAKIVFIEGGINDLPEGSIDSVVSQLQQIVYFFQSRDIIPVVTGLLYISPKAGISYPWRTNFHYINRQVTEINNELKNFTTVQKIDFIDLNPLLTDTTQLLDRYTTDGVHLTWAAYQIWSQQINQILQKHII